MDILDWFYQVSPDPMVRFWEACLWCVPFVAVWLIAEFLDRGGKDDAE